MRAEEGGPMKHLLALTSILLAAILLAMNTPAIAVDRTFQIEVENSLKGTVPSNWWLHASWRDQTLVVFVSPPTQESFNLWYDTARQKETLENLCKAIPVAIWNQVQQDQDIAVEQVVGGNGGKGSFQFSCRKYLAQSTD
jgi:hypothetical protein